MQNWQERQGKGFVLRDLPETHPNCRCGLSLVHEGLVDVTEIVMRALRERADEIYMDRRLGVNRVSRFHREMNHGGVWDIKRAEQWIGTLGIPVPRGERGRFKRFIFRGREITSEELGNYTYGYLGAANSFVTPALIGGSIVAAWRQMFPWGRMPDWDEIENELGDHPDILRGIRDFWADMASGLWQRLWNFSDDD